MVPFSDVWTDLAYRWTLLASDSAFVVAHRTGSFAYGQMTAEEMRSMVAEKPAAFWESVHSSAWAAAQGGHPAWVAEQALTPFGERAHSNAERFRQD